MGLLSPPELPLENKLGAIQRLFGRCVVVRLVLLPEKFLIVDCQGVSQAEADGLMGQASEPPEEEHEPPEVLPGELPEPLKPKLKGKRLMEGSAWLRSFK